MEHKYVNFHAAKLYNPDVKAIHCMAYQPKHKKLAVSRSDNNIEIWDTKYITCLQKQIFHEPPSSVENLKWFGKRLFSCGRHGAVLEYDLYSCTVKSVTLVTGGACWCLDITQKTGILAVGTEGGYINIFEVLDDGLNYVKMLDKQEGRILCLSWNKTGEYLVTGSVDTLRVWNYETGHAVHRMTTGRVDNKKETTVWCLLVTSDDVVISGDSRGYLCFWDAKQGTFIDKFISHKSDILALALTSDEQMLYCSGVDPLVAMYAKLLDNTGSTKKWAKSGHRRLHEHDVRSLAATKDKKLYSGGVDGFLTMSSFPPKVVVQFPPFIPGSKVTLSSNKQRIMFRYLDQIELYHIGDTVRDKVQLLLRMAGDGSKQFITASCSCDTSLIGYSTLSSVNFFKFTWVGDAPTLNKLQQDDVQEPCRHLVFYKHQPDGYRCIGVTLNNVINVYQFKGDEASIVHTINLQEESDIKDTVSHVVVSADCTYMVVADSKGDIAVWLCETWTQYCTLPKYVAPPTAVSVDPWSRNIIVVYSDNKLVEFSLSKLKYTSISRQVQDNWFRPRVPVERVLFDPDNKRALVMYDDSEIHVVAKSRTESSPDSKKPRMEVEEKYKTNHIQQFKHILHLDWLSDNTMLIICVDPLRLVQDLPSPFGTKQFGAR